uniref:Uncharacterized protein n=1 Tax=Chrysotila carterae TaxID=13221 RepID=A0A7S4BGH8_CHRCT
MEALSTQVGDTTIAAAVQASARSLPGQSQLKLSGTDESEANLRLAVLEVLRGMRQPARVNALSVAFRQQRGVAFKERYKAGMLRFLKVRSCDSLRKNVAHSDAEACGTEAYHVRQILLTGVWDRR